jgi:hypothetical protein
MVRLGNRVGVPPRRSSKRDDCGRPLSPVSGEFDAVLISRAIGNRIRAA